MPSPMNVPAVPQPEGEATPPRAPLVPERSDFLEGDVPAADKVQAFLAQALAATGTDAPTTAGALVPWICDALLSNHSVKAYGRDLMDFLRHMQAQGVTPLEVTADHVKLYKWALLEAGRTSATVARRLSVLRGTYKQLAAQGLISWAGGPEPLEGQSGFRFREAVERNRRHRRKRSSGTAKAAGEPARRWMNRLSVN